MSLRWIHENLEAPTCDEECSDIDDSCSDDSYDTDLSLHENHEVTTEISKETSKEIGKEIGKKNGKEVRESRKKRETRRPPTTTVKIDENGYGLDSRLNRKYKRTIAMPRQIARAVCPSSAFRVYEYN